MVRTFGSSTRPERAAASSGETPRCAICRRSRSLSEAGRSLFSASRARRASANDADRLRKYLQRYDLSWAQLQGD